MEQLILTEAMIVSGIVLAVTFIGIFSENLHGMERSKVAAGGRRCDGDRGPDLRFLFTDGSGRFGGLERDLSACGDDDHRLDHDPDRRFQLAGLQAGYLQ